MRNGLAAGPLPKDLPFADAIESACEAADFSPLVAYAIKINETGLDDPPTIVSGDGGHGLFQLTSSFPDDWADPHANAVYAVQNFMLPAEAFWVKIGMQGDDLVRCIAAEFNAGRQGAFQGHLRGDVDLFTTNRYGSRALSHYQDLVKGITPV